MFVESIRHESMMLSLYQSFRQFLWCFAQNRIWTWEMTLWIMDSI